MDKLFERPDHAEKTKCLQAMMIYGATGSADFAKCKTLLPMNAIATRVSTR